MLNKAQWITDESLYVLPRSEAKPITFQKSFDVNLKLKTAHLTCTALGIYEVKMNGQKVGDIYFAPGYTSYHNRLQVQMYDISSFVNENNILEITVAGGWAVGHFGYNGRKNRIYAKKQALLCELHLIYEDGSELYITTDESWRVTHRTAYKKAGIYYGEDFSANIKSTKFHAAKAISLPFIPKLIEGGPYVKEQEVMKPINVTESRNGFIYDFGQNFAGIIRAEIEGIEGQKIIIRHAEVLKDGELYTKPLRKAKARIIYTCSEGKQVYKPTFTYMGFRYCEVSGISIEKIKLTAIALYSEIEQIGGFKCSDENLNKLQKCVEWGAKSNFVDIPTDCPQRDERMGWTGDTAVFARTACFNFNMHDFYEKWLADMRVEQGENGAIPDVIPRSYLKNDRATPLWGDACALVPWASWFAHGDDQTLKLQYDCICKFIEEGLKHCTDYIWDKGFQYGDWCAPGEEYKDWIVKGKYTGTCYFASTVRTAAITAALIGRKEDQEYYNKLFDDISEAYIRHFTDGNGKVLNEFQSAYVLPLYFGMAGKYAQTFADHLAKLVKEADYHLTTGFAGTPYLLFALADYGYIDVAYKVLMQETCPSWLYEVKSGATTTWERWDAMKPDGSPNESGMLSYNHYAYGSVGDFLYRRIAGIEAVEAGYRKFRIEPMVGGGLTYAKAWTQCAYGRIESSWKLDGNKFTLTVTIPESTEAQIIMPSGSVEYKTVGTYSFIENLTN